MAATQRTCEKKCLIARSVLAEGDGSIFGPDKLPSYGLAAGGMSTHSTR
jgi:hypothetical protein